MFDNLIHIHQQYKQRNIGIELQLFKNIVTKTGTNKYKIEAYNEYLLLTNAAALPIGTKIISDTNSLEILSLQNDVECLEEFSGLITIELPANTTKYPILQFIQIIKQ